MKVRVLGIDLVIADTNPMEGHRFAGMETRRDNNDRATGYRGHCTCGHTELWNPDKNSAWEEIVSHWQPMIDWMVWRQLAHEQQTEAGK